MPIKRNTDPTAMDMRRHLYGKYRKLQYEKYSVEIAIYFFARDYYGGQFSNLYKAYTQSIFKPGYRINILEDMKDELAELYYKALKRKFAPTKRK